MKRKRPGKDPDATRRRILEAAFAEFYKQGFQGGSLNQIVEAAGTTKGALFHHFGGKQELGYALWTRSSARSWTSAGSSRLRIQPIRSAA